MTKPKLTKAHKEILRHLLNGGYIEVRESPSQNEVFIEEAKTKTKLTKAQIKLLQDLNYGAHTQRINGKWFCIYPSGAKCEIKKATLAALEREGLIQLTAPTSASKN